MLLIYLTFVSFEVAVVARLRPGAAGPAARWLSLGTREGAASGAVGLLPWALLCNRVAGALATGVGLSGGRQTAG